MCATGSTPLGGIIPVEPLDPVDPLDPLGPADDPLDPLELPGMLELLPVVVPVPVDPVPLEGDPDSGFPTCPVHAANATSKALQQDARFMLLLRQHGARIRCRRRFIMATYKCPLTMRG
jgi:hypothetical protein